MRQGLGERRTVAVTPSAREKSEEHKERKIKLVFDSSSSEENTFGCGFVANSRPKRKNSRKLDSANLCKLVRSAVHLYYILPFYCMTLSRALEPPCCIIRSHPVDPLHSIFVLVPSQACRSAQVIFSIYSYICCINFLYYVTFVWYMNTLVTYKAHSYGQYPSVVCRTNTGVSFRTCAAIGGHIR